MSHLGALKLAGPSEVLHAMWMAAYRDLQDVSAPDHDDLAAKWSARFLRVTFKFVLLKTDLDIFHAVENKREKMISAGAAVTSSGLQKVIKVIKYKEKYEADNNVQDLNAFQLYKHMTDNIKFSSYSEPVTETYVKEATAVYDKALSISAVFDIVSGCESCYALNRVNPKPLNPKSIIVVLLRFGQGFPFRICRSLAQDGDEGQGPNP